MGLGRVELPTSRLSGVRSNHLSYRPQMTYLSYSVQSVPQSVPKLSVLDCLLVLLDAVLYDVRPMLHLPKRWSVVRHRPSGGRSSDYSFGASSYTKTIQSVELCRGQSVARSGARVRTGGAVLLVAGTGLAISYLGYSYVACLSNPEYGNWY